MWSHGSLLPARLPRCLPAWWPRRCAPLPAPSLQPAGAGAAPPAPPAPPPAAPPAACCWTASAAARCSPAPGRRPGPLPQRHALLLPAPLPLLFAALWPRSVPLEAAAPAPVTHPLLPAADAAGWPARQQRWQPPAMLAGVAPLAAPPAHVLLLPVLPALPPPHPARPAAACAPLRTCCQSQYKGRACSQVGRCKFKHAENRCFFPAFAPNRQWRSCEKLVGCKASGEVVDVTTSCNIDQRRQRPALQARTSCRLQPCCPSFCLPERRFSSFSAFSQRMSTWFDLTGSRFRCPMTRTATDDSRAP